MARLINLDKELARLQKETWMRAEAETSVIRMFLSKAKEVDAVEVVHGRWNPKPYYKVDGNGGVFKYCDFYYCSQCTTERPIVPPDNYCPNCGAKMDGAELEEKAKPAQEVDFDYSAED